MSATGATATAARGTTDSAIGSALARDEAPLLSQIAANIVDWNRTPLPIAANRTARALLLDSIGCAVAARGHEMLAKVTRSLDAGDVARGFGSGLPRDLVSAVLDSGAAIRALDLNDFYWGPGIGGHPSDMFAPLLVLAEAREQSLGALLPAAAIAYEIYLDVLDAMAPDGSFDHCLAATLGATAGGSCLLRLSSEKTAHALAIAVAQGAPMGGVRYGAISETKGLGAALASVKAILALQLAAAGVTGPVAGVSGDKGLLALLADGQYRRALGDAAFASRIGDVTIKRYCCIGTAQAAVALAADLRSRLDPSAMPSARFTFRLADSPITRQQTTDIYRRPSNRETADHSFFALVAMALVDGDVSTSSFERGRFRDPDVIAMIDRLQFRCDLATVGDGRFSAAASAHMPDGKIVESACEAAPGHPSNPLSSEALRAKFRAQTDGRISALVTERIADLCLDGDEDAPVAAIIDQATENASA